MEELEDEIREAIFHANEQHLFTLDVTKHMVGKAITCDLITALHLAIRNAASESGYQWSVFTTDRKLFVTLY